MPSRFYKYALLCVPLALAACGDEWEMKRIDGIVPYVMERTAGTGVAYVRAKMLQEKELKVVPAQPEPVKSAEPVFEKKQQK